MGYIELEIHVVLMKDEWGVGNEESCTIVKYMTNGILLQEFLGEPHLASYR